MKTTFPLKAGAFALALALSPSWAIRVDAQTQPDNSKVNKRDRNPGEVTADQKKETAADRDMASKIRKALTDDKTLSTYAHNVKIVSQNGMVTLKGPVRSDAEVQAIVAKATQIAGSSAKIDNQLSVKP